MMGLLREAAARSPAVLTCGVYLTMQPPQRRYFATHLGGHGMGVLVNFGAISLLAPLIQRGVTASGAPPDIALIRERRQLTALIRGFSWMVVWSPTSVTQALLATSIAGVQLHGLVLYGLLTSLLMLGVGWSEDRLHWRGLARRVRADGWKASRPPPFPGRAFLSLAGVSAAIIASVIIFHWLLAIPTTHALMITAPLTLIVWLIAQGGTAAFAGEYARHSSRRPAQWRARNHHARRFRFSRHRCGGARAGRADRGTHRRLGARARQCS